MLAELAGEIFPPGVLNVVCGDRDTGPRPGLASRFRRWWRSPAVCGAGREVALAAANDLKRVHLELGGKAPVIVFDDVRCGRGGGGHRDRRLLQRGAGLHGGDSCPRRAGVSTRHGRRSGRSGSRHRLRRSGQHATRSSDRSTIPRSSKGLPAWSPGLPPTPTSSWAGSHQADRGSSSRLRSWPESSRETSWPRARSSAR